MRFVKDWVCLGSGRSVSAPHPEIVEGSCRRCPFDSGPSHWTGSNFKFFLFFLSLHVRILVALHRVISPSFSQISQHVSCIKNLCWVLDAHQKVSHKIKIVQGWVLYTFLLAWQPGHIGDSGREVSGCSIFMSGIGKHIFVDQGKLELGGKFVLWRTKL
jgi:hypothetical protein